MTAAGRAFLAQLTPGEARHLVALCECMGKQVEAARTLECSATLVKRRRTVLCEKAGVPTLRHLIVWCWRNGVVECPCGTNREAEVEGAA